MIDHPYNEKPFIYLASPYAHGDENVCDFRYRAACAAAMRLIHAGNIVFSPIAHSHGLHTSGVPSLSHEEWIQYDEFYLSKCDILMILQLEGWNESKGIVREVALVRHMGKPIIYIPWNHEVI